MVKRPPCFSTFDDQRLLFFLSTSAGLHMVQRNGRESQVRCIRLQLHVMNKRHGKKKLG
jgi:hypothetical protein